MISSFNLEKNILFELKRCHINFRRLKNAIELKSHGLNCRVEY